MIGSAWQGDERRTAQFNVRQQLMKAIDSEDDHKQRNTYMLMLGIIEALDNGVTRIEKKIDTILKDEKQIKNMALNGHTERHHLHHDWIEERMKLGGHCQWAVAKQKEEYDTKKSQRSMIQKFLEAVMTQAGTIITTAALVALGFAVWK